MKVFEQTLQTPLELESWILEDRKFLDLYKKCGYLLSGIFTEIWLSLGGFSCCKKGLLRRSFWKFGELGLVLG